MATEVRCLPQRSPGLGLDLFILGVQKKGDIDPAGGKGLIFVTLKQLKRRGPSPKIWRQQKMEDSRLDPQNGKLEEENSPDPLVAGPVGSGGRIFRSSHPSAD